MIWPVLGDRPGVLVNEEHGAVGCEGVPDSDRQLAQVGWHL